MHADDLGGKLRCGEVSSQILLDGRGQRFNRIWGKNPPNAIDLSGSLVPAAIAALRTQRTPFLDCMLQMRLNSGMATKLKAEEAAQRRALEKEAMEEASGEPQGIC